MAPAFSVRAAPWCRPFCFRCLRPEGLCRFFGILDPCHEGAKRWIREALFNHLINQAPKLVPVAVDVHHDDRLVVQPQLAPGQNLEEIVQRACPAGQNHDGIGVHEHDFLPLVHGFGDHE